MKKKNDEIDKFLDALFKGGFFVPDFSMLTIEGLLAAFREDPLVTSAEYKNGAFHIETKAGPIDFSFTQEKEDA
ncbi:hypothetical protein HY798_02660 [Candidatus Falkowbacteria bacterium]|nr:hypothetical protein [Candidatus Falkowbacteria bacterium]